MIPRPESGTYVPHDDRCLVLVPEGGLLEHLRDFAAVRAASITLVEGLDAAAWQRAGLANGKDVTPPTLAFMLHGHAQHHLNVLAERYRA